MKFIRNIFKKATDVPPPLPPPSKPTPTVSDDSPIRLAVGPSPWAWRDRSHITGGSRYRFRELSPEPNLAGITKVINDNEEILLLLDFQIYARFLDDGRMLMWWEESSDGHRQIAFTQVRLSDLPSISAPTDAAKAMREKKSMVSGVPYGSILRFNSLLDAGRHEIDSPSSWADFEETLVLGEHANGGNGYDSMHRAVFVFNWLKRSVTVLPQDWFNSGSYDFGYQWIARIARTKSGKLIGEGIRLGTFELDDEGRNVKRWFTQNPFHAIE